MDHDDFMEDINAAVAQADRIRHKLTTASVSAERLDPFTALDNIESATSDIETMSMLVRRVRVAAFDAARRKVR